MVNPLNHELRQHIPWKYNLYEVVKDIALPAGMGALTARLTKWFPVAQGAIMGASSGLAFRLCYRIGTNFDWEEEALRLRGAKQAGNDEGMEAAQQQIGSFIGKSAGLVALWLAAPLLTNAAMYKTTLRHLVSFRIVSTGFGTLALWGVEKGLKAVLTGTGLIEPWEFEYGLRERLSREPSGLASVPAGMAEDGITLLPLELELEELPQTDVNELVELCQTIDWGTTESPEQPIRDAIMQTGKMSCVESYQYLAQVLRNLAHHLLAAEPDKQRDTLLRLGKAFNACQSQWLTNAHRELKNLVIEQTAIDARLDMLDQDLKLTLISSKFVHIEPRSSGVHFVNTFRSRFHTELGFELPGGHDAEAMFEQATAQGVGRYLNVGDQERRKALEAIEKGPKGWIRAFKAQYNRPEVHVEMILTSFNQDYDDALWDHLGQRIKRVVGDALTDAQAKDLAQDIYAEWIEDKGGIEAPFLNQAGAIFLLEQRGRFKNTGRLHPKKTNEELIAQAKA